MTLEPAVIAELLLQAGPDLPRFRSTARPGIAVSDAPDELLDAIARLLRLLDRPRDRKVLAPYSPSQFSREYRRLFGAPPSLDAVRLRGGAGPAATALP
jgi:hypothetical protein